MLTFNRKYFILTIIFFLIEVIIALFVNDNFIRPYLGDVLVVILLYCFFKTFLNYSSWSIALFVLLFSFTVETLQYVNFIEKLGLEDNRIAKIVIGNTFSWEDIVSYIIGILVVLMVEEVISKKNTSKT